MRFSALFYPKWCHYISSQSKMVSFVYVHWAVQTWCPDKGNSYFPPWKKCMHFLSATLSFPHLFDTWLSLNDCFWEVFELSSAIFRIRAKRGLKIARESSKTSKKQSFKRSQVSNRCGKESVKPEKMHAFLTGWDNIFLPNERHCA